MMKQISESEFEKLVYENQSLIVNVCNVYCKTQADKDDLFQDITINLWRGLPSYKGNAKISTWIYRVSLNTAISNARKNRRNKISYPENIPRNAFTLQVEEHRDQSLIQALYAGIDRLKPVEKAIILLYLERHSYEQIADIIGISKKNVSVKLVRIKKRLKVLIDPASQQIYTQ